MRSPVGPHVADVDDDHRSSSFLGPGVETYEEVVAGDGTSSPNGDPPDRWRLPVGNRREGRPPLFGSASRVLPLRRSVVEKLVAVGEHDRGGAVAEVEFGEHRAEVCLDGCLTDVELLGDFCVGEAPADSA